MFLAKGKFVNRWNHICMVLGSFLQGWPKNLARIRQQKSIDHWPSIQMERMLWIC